jgi:hypothetical protein
MAQFNRAVIFSGHMIDQPDRYTPRFPPQNELAVANLLRSQLQAWHGGRETLAVCGAAAGGDILFAESACAIGARVHLLLPFGLEAFVADSVEPAGVAWVERFQRLTKRCTILCQPDVLGPEPNGCNAYQRNNLWILDHARAELPGGPILALLLWDAHGGDGIGGTADFARRCTELAAETVVIHPTTVEVSAR